ncbi:MAG: ParB/RepB/Spo0J family partition protein [Variibacter sp.]|nr:ParB/RepB/Spo0J family partition protein [Variibacter sp.]
MAEEAKSRLGRGLAALIGDVGDETAAIERVRAQRRVPVEFVKPNPRNPRRTFSELELEGLAASIRERGVIQPILVRTVRGAADSYEIIAGERRWRAAQRAGLHEVPIVLLEASDREALELAIIENVQRADLNALEEAMGYQALAEEFGHGQEEIAKIVGKSRSHVANTLRLLNLPDAVKAYVTEGKISAGHARALLAVPDPEAVAREVVERGLNVRAVEAVAQREAAAKGRTATPRPRAQKDADTRALEKRLSDHLGLAVSIQHGPAGGELRVKYRTLEQLEAVTRRLEQ